MEFETVSALLEKTDYLGDGTGSNRFGGADLAFSALAGWLVLPDNFHNGQVRVPERKDLPTDLLEFMEAVAKTSAAHHVKRCYSEHRRCGTQKQ